METIDPELWRRFPIQFSLSFGEKKYYTDVILKSIYLRLFAKWIDLWDVRRNWRWKLWEYSLKRAKWTSHFEICNLCEPLWALVGWSEYFFMVFLTPLTPTILSPFLQDSPNSPNVWLWVCASVSIAAGWRLSDDNWVSYKAGHGKWPVQAAHPLLLVDSWEIPLSQSFIWPWNAPLNMQPCFQ